MNILLFLIFLAVSWLLLMNIYGFSTYHKNFKYAVIILIIYGSLIGYLIHVFNFDRFYLWYAGLIIIFLYKNYRKQSVGMRFMKETLKVDLDDPSIILSYERTLHYHILSSIIFVITVLISYLIIFNMQFL